MKLFGEGVTMKLGIPTLNRYDLLTKLLVSAEAGTVVPSEYIIVDNGGSYVPPDHLKEKVRLIRPGCNVGVASAWNMILEVGLAEDEPIAISNDDIVFETKTFELLQNATDANDFVGACGGWALFAQSPRCVAEVGFYDEHFYPAYYEDCDYLLRLKRAGIPVFDLGFIGAHAGEQSTVGSTPEQRALVAEGRMRNYSYFVTKWGADSPRWGNPLVENYAEPFDGKLTPKVHPGGGETDFFLRERTRISPLRWDVLNFIAKLIDAKRYLEIGVADGSCMQKIEVEERWGVDPNPQSGAIAAASIFVPRTSDFFFEHVAPNAGLFDLVFIDGDHRHEQVYREVQAARKYLSPTGVICLHDCNPHTEEMQQVPLVSGWQWTGDVWKAVARLRAEGELDVAVIPSDYGIGVVLPTDRAMKKIALPCEYDRLLLAGPEEGPELPARSSATR